MLHKKEHNFSKVSRYPRWWARHRLPKAVNKWPISCCG